MDYLLNLLPTFSKGLNYLMFFVLICSASKCIFGWNKAYKIYAF